MTDETKKQRKPSYTVSKWAEENGYTDAMLALLGDDAKKIMPSVKAKEQSVYTRIKALKLKQDHDAAILYAEVLEGQASALDAIKSRLDAIKKAATST